MSTGLKRVEIMEIYTSMKDAQQRRVEVARMEDERRSFLSMVDTPSSDHREQAVTFPRFLRSMRSSEAPPTAEQNAAMDLSWELHGAASAALWQIGIKGGVMQIEVIWTEEVQHTSVIGLNIDNVEAAGLDPTVPEDVLIYLREHMDPQNFEDQVGKGTHATSATPPSFIKVNSIDTRSMIEAVA